MKTSPITIRGPADWAGQMDSERVRAWLIAFLENPSALPADPGAGAHRFTVWLPRGAVKKIAARLGLEPSEFLRRLIAAHVRAVSSTWAVPARSKPLARPAPAPQVLDAELVESRPGRLMPAFQDRPAPEGFAWASDVKVVPVEEMQLERRMRERLDELQWCGAFVEPVSSWWPRVEPRPVLPAAGGDSLDWPRWALWLLLASVGIWLFWKLLSRKPSVPSAVFSAVQASPLSFKSWLPLG